MWRSWPLPHGNNLQAHAIPHPSGHSGPCKRPTTERTESLLGIAPRRLRCPIASELRKGPLAQPGAGRGMPRPLPIKPPAVRLNPEQRSNHGAIGDADCRSPGRSQETQRGRLSVDDGCCMRREPTAATCVARRKRPRLPPDRATTGSIPPDRSPQSSPAASTIS